MEQLGKGFERLFEYVDDLEIDVPGAPGIVAAFLARALVDGEQLISFGLSWLCLTAALF